MRLWVSRGAGRRSGGPRGGAVRPWRLAPPEAKRPAVTIRTGRSRTKRGDRDAPVDCLKPAPARRSWARPGAWRGRGDVESSLTGNHLANRLRGVATRAAAWHRGCWRGRRPCWRVGCQMTGRSLEWTLGHGGTGRVNSDLLPSSARFLSPEDAQRQQPPGWRLAGATEKGTPVARPVRKAKGLSETAWLSKGLDAGAKTGSTLV